jgi:predicted Zn-dependent protease
MIAPLEPPDSHHLSAAEGWLELGNPVEAAAELQLIGPPWSAHPSVLEMDWQIHASARQWADCLELAARQIQLLPNLPAGWIHRSYALHELKRTAEARDLLLPAITQFPNEAILTYNLACYECCLGNLDGARQWLKKTFTHKNALPWRIAAHSDSDLERLWPEIDGL